jgi:hypothetical protein
MREPRLITAETAHINLDVFIPRPQPNVFRTGDLSLLFDCPAAGISNLTVGSQTLTGRFQNEFNAFSYTVPSNVLAALRGNFSGCRFLVYVNAAAGAGTFFPDRMGFLHMKQLPTPVVIEGLGCPFCCYPSRETSRIRRAATIGPNCYRRAALPSVFGSACEGVASGRGRAARGFSGR